MTTEMITSQKKWIQEDLEKTKKRFIKQNTLFKQITADITEHPDWDLINKKMRRFQRKILENDNQIKQQRLKLSFIKKSLTLETGIQLLSKTEIGYKKATNTLKAISNEDLVKLKYQQALKIKEIPESNITVTAIDKGDYDDPACLVQEDTNTRWIVYFKPKETWVKF